jgi:hypothetical protein
MNRAYGIDNLALIIPINVGIRGITEVIIPLKKFIIVCIMLIQLGHQKKCTEFEYQ